MMSRVTQSVRFNRSISGAQRSVARAATGYLGGPDGMETYSANVARELTVFTASNCNAVEPTDEDPRGAYGLTPWCINSNGLFATSNYANKAYVYRSADGTTNWTLAHDFGYATSKDCMAMMVTATGRLIAWVEDGAGGYAVWYTTGDNDGTAWSRAKDNLGADLSFTDGYPAPWGWGEAHGTIVAGGWVSPDVAGNRELWRSTDDGETWTRVQLLTVDDTDHSHAIAYHAGMDRWVVDYGDDWTGAEQRTYFSDDDGVTWYNPIAPKTVSVTGRCTRLIDYGHPTRILIGSDHYQRIGWFDLDTLEIGTFCRYQSSWDHAYGFMLAQHNGVWYWGSSDAVSGNGKAPIIRVSLDLVNWVTYWRPTRTDFYHVYQFIGELNGKLHFQVHDTDSTTSLIDEHLILDPAKISTRTGILVSPGKTNLLGDRPSKCDLITDWDLVQSGDYDISEVDTTEKFAPGSVGSLHLKKTDVTYTEWTGVSAAAACTVSIGERYQPHVWIKGTCFFARAYCAGQTGADITNYTVNRDGWTEIWGNPLTATDTSITVVILGAQDQSDNSSEIWIGAAELVPCPAGGEWSPGGVAQPADVASVELELETHWTHVFSFMALNDSDELTDGSDSPVYLHSYVAPGGDFVNLYFDPADSKLKMESTVDASPTGSPIETTGTRQIDREHLFRIAVRYAAGEVSFSVFDGASVEHVSPITHAGDVLSGAGIVLTTGDESGENVMHGVLIDDYVLPGCLSDDEIAALFDQPGNVDQLMIPSGITQIRPATS
jgi:hypothetical protein